MEEDKETKTVDRPYDSDKDPEAKSDTGQLLRVAKRKEWKWWILVCCAIIIMVFSALHIILVRKCTKEIKRYKDECLREVSSILKAKYGNQIPENNGFEYFNDLPDMDAIAENTYGDSDSDCNNLYFCLSVAEKKKRLEELDAFKRCEDILKVLDYDVLVPKHYYKYIYKELAKNELWENEMHLNLINSIYAIECLCACADYYIENGEVEKGKKLLFDALTLISMYPDEYLLDMMIGIRCKQHISSMIIRHIDKYSLEDMLKFRKKIGHICLAAPQDYYNCYLFSSMNVIEYYFCDDSWNPWYKSLWHQHPWVISEQLRALIKGHTITRTNIKKGDFVNAQYELEEFLIKYKEDFIKHIFFTNIKSWGKGSICHLESDTYQMVILILFSEYIYRLQNNEYPESFKNIVNDLNHIYLTVSGDGDTINFRGYEIGLIKKMQDGTLYSSPDNRKKYFGVYATPLDYGNSGQTTYIVNEEGKVYQMDFGTITRIEQLPKNLKKDWGEEQ